MSISLQSYSKKYYFFCSITGVIIQCYYLFLFFHFIDARIYFGEKPFTFGVNSSELFVDIINWVGIAGGGMSGIGIIYLLVDRKNPWCLTDSKKVVWFCTIGGLFLLLYGGYGLLKYYGKELYCDIDPVLTNAGQPYLIDIFLYMPLFAVTVAVLWGGCLLYRLYHSKGSA